MGGGNGQKSKMAREWNAEKNKASKGTYARPTTRSPPLRFLPSIDSSCFGGFCSIPCRQPARGQQEGHEQLEGGPYSPAEAWQRREPATTRRDGGGGNRRCVATAAPRPRAWWRPAGAGRRCGGGGQWRRGCGGPARHGGSGSARLADGDGGWWRRGAGEAPATAWRRGGRGWWSRRLAGRPSGAGRRIGFTVDV